MVENAPSYIEAINNPCVAGSPINWQRQDGIKSNSAMAFNYDSDRYSDCSGSKDHQMAACNGAGGGIEMMPLNQWDNVETSVLVPPGHQLSYDPVLPQTPRTPQKKILSQGGQSSSNNPTPKKQLQFSTSEIVHEPPISIITSRALLPNRKR